MPEITYPSGAIVRDPISKGYRNIVFLSNPSQSGEMNDLQVISAYNQKILADSIYSDAYVISGGYSHTNDKTIQFSPTVTKALGLMFEIPEMTVEITGEGSELIGLYIKETYVTAEEDKDLLNQSQGTANYRTKGADRVKYDAKWALFPGVELPEGEFFYSVYTFEEGVLQNLTNPDESDAAIISLIAEYDYSSNGSYVVEGMDVFFVSSDEDRQVYIFEISAGRAHVDGYRVIFPYARRFTIPFITETNSVSNEPHTFDSGRYYKTRWSPIAGIQGITGVRQNNSKSITHGSFVGAKDLLDTLPVVSIVTVSSLPNGSGTVYVSGRDYVQDGDFIDWSPAGIDAQEPAPGATYYVTYQYQVSLPVQISEDRTSFYIENLVVGSVFNVDYTYYLSRVDRVVLLNNGEIFILRGNAKNLNPVPQLNSSGLSLATISLSSASNPGITYDTYKAYKMSDIQLLVNRMSAAEYNIAELSMKDEIRTDYPVTTKLNMIVDPFLNDNQRDAGLEQNALIVNSTLIPGMTFNTHFVRVSNNNIYLDSTESRYIANEYATKDRQIDRYTWAGVIPGTMSVSPAAYSWVDEDVYKTMGSGSVNYATTTEVVESNATAIVPQITLTINGERFNNGEVVDFYFNGSKVGTATANANGYISNFQYTLPAGLRSGVRRLELKGPVSGVEASTTFTATPLIRTVTQFFRSKNEPLAQTFQNTDECMVSSVELFVTEFPDQYIDLIMCPTIVGFPDRENGMEFARLYRNQIVKNAWNKFTFTNPVKLEAEQLYAFVIECVDTNAKIKVSELGEWDNTKKVWVTKQGYDQGVLLESADSITWSPFHKEDATFRLNRKNFQPTKNVTLGTISVVNATDLMLSSVTSIYAGTSIEYTATLLDRGNERYVIASDVSSSIAKYTGRIQIDASLSTSNPLLSPVIFGDVFMTIGTVTFPSNYITRTFDVTSSGTSNIRVIVDLAEVGDSTVTVQYRNASSVWTNMARNSTGTPLGNGYVRVQFNANTVNLRSTAIQLLLNSSSDETRPNAKNLKIFIEPS